MEQTPVRYKQDVNDDIKTPVPLPLVSYPSAAADTHIQNPYAPPFQLHVPPGHAAFRLLFHKSVIRAAYGEAAAATSESFVIADGTDCKSSGFVARVLESVPNCDQRVVLVTGPDDGKHEEEPATAAHSAAQHALLRVYDKLSGVERRLHDESKDDGSAAESTSKCTVQCSMLAPAKLIGGLMGRRGAVIQDIRSRTGTRIIVFVSPTLPLCAAPTDELIQISGAVLAVRKAIIDVSYRLQAETRRLDVANMNCEAKPPPSLRNVEEQQTTGCVSHKSINTGKQNYSVPAADLQKYHISASDKDTIPLSSSTANCGVPSSSGSEILEEISFRLLCSIDAVGGIIGRGGSIVQAIEKETGTKILISPPARHCDDRIVTICAYESLHSNLSPAQEAVCRVFTRSLEACIENGYGPCHDNIRIVTARLLVSCNNIGCIMGVRGSIISEIRRITSTRIIVIAGSPVPAYASENDEVVEVSGSFNNVLDALFHITTRLRQDIFSNKGLTYNIGNEFHSATNLGSYKHAERFRGRSHNANHHETITHNMNQIRLDNDTSYSSFPCKWAHKNDVDCEQRRNSSQGRDLVISTEAEGQRNSKPFVVTNTTLQIVVPADIIGKIYGEGGSNLNQIKEISGAEVSVQEPTLGSSEGIVTISGAPDRAFAAQSLLHAFSCWVGEPTRSGNLLS